MKSILCLETRKKARKALNWKPKYKIKDLVKEMVYQENLQLSENSSYLSMIDYNSKIFVAGYKGLVGSAILRKLKEQGYKNIITVNKKKLDLRDQIKVFF